MRSCRHPVLLGCALAITVGLGLGASVAHAAPTDVEAAAAREHYKRGTKLYDLGKYDDAISEFTQAYEIKDDPVLLYNIAQSHRLSLHYSEALKFYRTYLRKSPKAPNKDEVEQKIADMETLIAQQSRVANAPPAEAIPMRGDRPAAGSVAGKPTPDPVMARNEPRGYTPPPPPPEEKPAETTPPAVENKPAETTITPNVENKPAETGTGTVSETHIAEKSEPVATSGNPGRGKTIAGVVIAVVGLAALGAGIFEGVTAMGKSSDQEKLAMGHMQFDPNLESDGKSAQTIGLVLDAVGGALVLTGAIVAGLGASQKAERAPRTAFIPTLSHHSAGASLSIRF